MGDCNAKYFPKLSVNAQPINLTAVAGGLPTNPLGYIAIQNSGSGLLNWTATATYDQGTGWIKVDTDSGQNNGSVRVWADPKGLSAGTYNGAVVIDAGPLAGTVSVPVKLTVTAAPVTPPTPAPPTATAPTVVVNKAVNAATFEQTPLVAGSLGTLMGNNLTGKTVAATFDSKPATILYSDAHQINLQVPDVSGKTSASVVVTVDGVSSTPVTVPLAPAWPSVFANGVLNQDNSVNGADSGAKAGSYLQIFATGIPADAVVSVEIGGHKGLAPVYAGVAPTVPGVQQVNVAVPDDVDAGPMALVICASMGGQQYCSAGTTLVVK